MNARLRPSVEAWRCRVCAFDRYHRVSVLRKNGARYETSFFACSQCSVMFVNPTHFDHSSTENPSIKPTPSATEIRRKT